MVLWTIFVMPIEEDEIKEVEIDSEQTFGEFRSIVSNMLPNINSNDLIFTADKEYNYEYNSKKLSEIYYMKFYFPIYLIIKKRKKKLSFIKLMEFMIK